MRYFSGKIAVFVWIFLVANFVAVSQVRAIGDNWLSGYTYRKQIDITGQTGAGTDFQVKIKVGQSSGSTGADFHLGGNASSFPTGKNTGGDLRFTTNDGSTLLNFWVESVAGSGSNKTATVWVKVAANLSSNQTIYIYYGNGSATNASSGPNTFLLFDDFDTNSNTLDSTLWGSTKSGTATISVNNSNSQITFTNSNTTNYAWVYSKNTFDYTAPVWTETKMDSFSCSGATLRMGVTTGTSPRLSGPAANGNLYEEYSGDIVGSGYRIVGDVLGSPYGWQVNATASCSDTSGIWSFAWPTNSSQKFNVNYASKLTGTDSTISIANYYMYFGNAASTSGSSVIDWARARKYAATDPSVSSAGSQETETYTLTYTAGSNGSISGNSPQTVTHGTSGSAVTAVASSHYHFVNWSDGSAANPRTDTSVNANVSVTANFAIDTYSVTYSAGSHGAITGTSGQTINYGGDSSAVTATADAGYHFTNWSDGSTANPRTDYNVTATISVTANFVANDVSAPVITSVSASPSTTSADITWNTDEDASSQVQYGLNTSYGFSTAELDTSPRVSSHTVALSGLTACARYYYRVISKDATNNQSASAQKSFTTTGCTASSVTSGSEDLITTSGGSVTLVNNLSTAGLTIPNNYYSEQATFQINKLDTGSAPSSPSGKSIANNNFYDLVAVTSNNQQLTSFDRPITFSVNYGSDTEADYQENTLDVYKYNGSSWDKKNCTLDTASNTLTCSLSSFSVYAVLGDPKSASSTSSASSFSSSSSSGSSSSCSGDKPVNAPDLFQIDTTSTTAKLFFTPISNTNDYFISYATNKSAEEFGTGTVTLAREGVQNMTISYLSPNTTYYFKVRGQNGCMPGDWSNVLSIVTNARIYYRNSTPSAPRQKTVSPIKSTKTNSKVQKNNDTPVSTKPSAPPVKKKCFLWVCW